MTPAEIAKLEAPPTCDWFATFTRHGETSLLFDGNSVETLYGSRKEVCACVALQYWRMEAERLNCIPDHGVNKSYEAWQAAKAQITAWERFGFGEKA